MTKTKKPAPLWAYRLVRLTGLKRRIRLSEVYFDGARPTGFCSTSALSFVGDPDEIRDTLLAMLDGASKPVLDAEEIRRW